MGALLVVLLAVVPIVFRLLKAFEKLNMLPGVVTELIVEAGTGATVAAVVDAGVVNAGVVAVDIVAAATVVVAVVGAETGAAAVADGAAAVAADDVGAKAVVVVVIADVAGTVAVLVATPPKRLLEASPPNRLLPIEAPIAPPPKPLNMLAADETVKNKHENRSELN